MKVLFGLMAIFHGVVGQANDMSRVFLPETTSPGGFCNDGTMAGYYIREGNPDSSLFVIYLKGGGGCFTEEECDNRSMSLKSSSGWGEFHTGDGLLSQDCEANPSFCEATAVYVPYCTSDTHRGSNLEKVWDKYYFDGHANFAAIVEKLIVENGLGSTKSDVLLTGGSAGGIGALFNVDWLSDRLPDANVKAVPNAGWYYPGSLAGDLPSLFAPSDYPHFAANETGNAFYDQYQIDPNVEDLFNMQSVLSDDCLADYPDKWWVCSSADNAYRYIKSPLFILHTQYDKNQIFAQNGAPGNPVDDVELAKTEDYIEMWGRATRESLQQILQDEVINTKAHPDGLFSASCYTHGTPTSVKIKGMGWMEIFHDWFFQLGEYDSFHRLVEEPCLDSDKELPCNAYQACTKFPFGGGGDPPTSGLKKCAKKLFQSGCLKSFQNKELCYECARSNSNDLKEAGCTRTMVQTICEYVEENDIDDFA